MNTAPRWFFAIITGFLITAAGGSVYKFFIETFTDQTYVIHWLETVPVLTLIIAFFLQKSWKIRPETEIEPVH